MTDHSSPEDESRSCSISPLAPREIIYGTEGSDVPLTGTSGDDTICGLGAADVLHGNGGDDWLYGGDGGDLLYGGDGDDHLEGGDGNDVLYGGNGDDHLYGGNGVDDLYGGDSDDELYGGNDADHLYGGNGNDDLYGGDGWDELIGGDGNDYIEGGAGGDVIEGGKGTDVLDAGAGNRDILLYDTTNGSVTVDLAVDAMSGYARASGGNAGRGDDRDFFKNFELYVFYGTRNEGYVRGTDSTETIRASSDTVRVTVDGGAGNDTLDALGDALFILKGGAGSDAIFGGAGNDKIVDYQGSNRLLDGGEGVDTLSYFLSDAGVEVDLRVNLATITRISDAGARTVETSELRSIENVVGSNHDDVIIVPDRDVVYGLDGRGGTDRIQFDLAQGDFVVGLWGERGASVTRNGKSDGTLNFEEYVFTGEGNIRVEGTFEDNRFHVTESAEATVRFIGGGGADIFTGGEGTDYFVYASLTDSTTAAADVIHGFTAGTDKLDLSRIAGVSWDDVAVRSLGEDLVITVDGGLEIMLKGIASLSESDFIFADGA